MSAAAVPAEDILEHSETMRGGGGGGGANGDGGGGANGDGGGGAAGGEEEALAVHGRCRQGWRKLSGQKRVSPLVRMQWYDQSEQ